MRNLPAGIALAASVGIGSLLYVGAVVPATPAAAMDVPEQTRTVVFELFTPAQSSGGG